MTFSFDTDLWRSTSKAGWFFLSLPPDVTDAILDEIGDITPKSGTVPVEVTVGSTTWQTSVFQGSQTDSYVLPVKKAVREAEGIDEGDRVTVTLATTTA